MGGTDPIAAILSITPTIPHPMSQENIPDFEREIAALAHRYWQEEGYPQDRAVQHWERAERELRQRFGSSPADGQAPGGIPNDTGAAGKLG